MRKHTPPRLAQGYIKPSGNRKFNIEFDKDTYEQVQAMAAASRSSFAAQVRLLVEWGLEAEKEYR